MKHFIAAVLLFALPASAADEGLQAIPKWTFTGKALCYDHAGGKELLRLDAELVKCRETGPRLELVNESLLHQVTELKGAVIQKDNSIRLLEGELNASLDREKVITKEKNQAEAKSPNLTLPLVTGGVGVVVGIVLGVVLSVTR